MRYLFVVLLLSTFINVFSQPKNWASGGKLKPEQAIMDIRHYTLTLQVDPSTQSIRGNTEIDVIMLDTSSVLMLDLVNVFTVKKVFVNGRERPFTHQDDIITVRVPESLQSGKSRLKIEYEGKPPVAQNPPWLGGFQWSKDQAGNPWIAISCQNEGPKIYFPCKDHPSDEPNEGVDLFITVPKSLVVAGPGLLQKVTNQKNTSTYYWKTNYTINTYSIVFNIAKYKVATRTYKTIEGKNVPMVFYVLEENYNKAGHHLDLLERSAKVLEKYFGEYPFVKEKIGIAETPHLGMEHQTMNAYGNKFNYTKVGGEDFDWLLHHEFGHEWWGNKVTAKDWADMWIQEGICSFGDAMYTREWSGEEEYLKRMQNTARSTQNQKPVIVGKDIDSDDAYHGDIYGKGAFFMHTLRYVIGDEIFFPTLKLLATDPKYTYDNLVNTDDVEKLFTTASGKDLGPLFNLYLRTTSRLEIHVRQDNPTKYTIKLLNIGIPLPVEITTDSGTQKMIVNNKGISVTSKTLPLVDPKTYYLKKVIFEY